MVSLGQLLKSREDASIMLDLVYETLHQMALFVPMFVILALLLPIGSWRYDCLSLMSGDELQEVVKII